MPASSWGRRFRIHSRRPHGAQRRPVLQPCATAASVGDAVVATFVPPEPEPLDTVLDTVLGVVGVTAPAMAEPLWRMTATSPPPQPHSAASDVAAQIAPIRSLGTALPPSWNQSHERQLRPSWGPLDGGASRGIKTWTGVSFSRAASQPRACRRTSFKRGPARVNSFLGFTLWIHPLDSGSTKPGKCARG